MSPGLLDTRARLSDTACLEMPMYTALVVTLALSGCSGGEDDTGRRPKRDRDDTGTTTETTDTDTTYVPPPWEPSSGSYGVTSETPVTNTCGEFDTEPSKPRPIEITVTEDATSMTLVGDDPVDEGTLTVTATCPLTQILEPDIHYPFDCDDLVTDLNLDSYNMRAIMSFTVDLTGDFTTETHFTGNNRVAIACTGPDCGTVSDFLEIPFPCEVVSTTEMDKL